MYNLLLFGQKFCQCYLVILFTISIVAVRKLYSQITGWKKSQKPVQKTMPTAALASLLYCTGLKLPIIIYF